MRCNIVLGVVSLFGFTLISLAAPQGQAQEQQERLSIVVDKACLIQPESDPLVLGDHFDAFRDDAICHLESVLTSHHIEEKITETERSRFFVRVAEQEYVVQNPTEKPAIFIVRHKCPEELDRRLGSATLQHGWFDGRVSDKRGTGTEGAAARGYASKLHHQSKVASAAFTSAGKGSCKV